MAWPAVKLPFSQEQFRGYVAKLKWGAWRPSLFVWHNTAAPSLQQWLATAKTDRDKGIVPGTTRIHNLERYFRDDRKWTGGPHLFIAPDYIWVFNPLTMPGVHSPSWNSTSLGFEMVGDFSVEDDDTGDGLRVKNNCIFATAVLCETLGLDPSTSIRLHKQDPKTTHDCPGKNIARDKDGMIGAVRALMSGGEHGEPSSPSIVSRKAVTSVNGLTLRAAAGVMNRALASLPINTSLSIIGEARNGSTGWSHVRLADNREGWVASRYLKEAP